MITGLKYILIILIVLSLKTEQVVAQVLPDSTSDKLELLTDVEKVKYLSDLSWSLREKNTDLAIVYSEYAVKLVDSLDITGNTARTYALLGVIYIHYKYDIKQAIPFIHKGLELALQFDDSVEIAYSYNNLGDAFYLTGNFPFALEYSKRSLEYFEKLNNLNGIAYTYTNLGLLYRHEKEYETALDYFWKAIELRKQIGFDVGIASALHEIALVYFDKNDLDKALEYFEESLELHKKINNVRYIAFCLNGIGDVYYEQGKYLDALKMYDKSLKLDMAKSHDYGVISNKLGKALVYSELNMRSKGEEELKSAFEKSVKLGLAPKLLEAYEASTKFYFNVNDFKSATENFNDFFIVYDSLLKQQQFETLTEIDERQKISRELKETNLELQLRKSEERTLLIVIVLLLIIVSGLVVRYLAKKKSTNKLKALNDSKDKLFAIISHDLKNPFSALLGLVGFLKEEDTTEEERKEYIESIDSVTKDTYRLLENLLNLSASRTGNLKYSPGFFSIKELTEKLAKSMSTYLKNKSINLDLNIIGDEIFADRQMIEVILRNLLTNAIKFSNASGSIIVSFEIANDYYLLTVKDQGIGMDQEVMSKLFTSEVVKSNTGTAGERGTGIGLSLCNEFVKEHSGSIDVKSEPGKGSEFIVKIPARKKYLSKI